MSQESTAQILQSKENTKILLSAEFIERDNEKGITILRGNVQVILEQNFISCNEAIILWANNEVIAVGNVILKTPKSDIQADKLVYNITTQQGKIFNGIILSGKVLIQSDFIEKTGPDTYKSKSAYLTSCVTCPASWSFTAENVDATIEGYAYISSTWLHILEVPFIYLPYLILPLKNERQTGLLPPSFEQNPYAGSAIDLPYFWALSKSQDMTFTAKQFFRSGPQAMWNYRYRLSEKSGGELNTAILWDSQQNNKKRWFNTYSHYLELPHGYIQKTNINLTSDQGYVKDFYQQFPYLGFPALDNRTSLTKNFEDFHLSIDTSYYVSLVQDNFSDGREASVHRLPEVRFSLTDKKILDKPPVFFRFDSQYINIARQGLGYDSPFLTNTGVTGYRPNSPTGAFDPTNDKIRTGQRLDMTGTAYSPLRTFGKALDITPYAIYRHTQYVLGALNEAENFDFFPHRNYTQLGVNTSTEISAIYQGSESRYKHSIVPAVDFQAITNFYQSNHIFFGAQGQTPYFLQTQPLQDLDLAPSGRGLQFDYEDRIVGRRLMNLSITNKLMEKTSSALGTHYRQNILFSLSQAYDLIEAKNETGRPWQDIRGLLNVRMGKVDSFTEVFSFPYHKVTNVSSRLRLNVVDTNYFEVIYTNYLNVPALPADVNRDLRQEALWLSTGLHSTYITISGQVEYSLLEQDQNQPFKRWNLNTEIVPPGRCWSLTATMFQILDTKEIGGTAMLNFKFGN
jgi:LPS-assembly protein